MSINNKLSKFWIVALLAIMFGFAHVASAQAPTWEVIGYRNISSGSSNYAVLEANAAGTPYVLFNDSQYGDKATVMSWDGTNWNAVGPRGFTNAAVVQNGDLTFDANGNVWAVTVGDLNTEDNLEVWKFDGSSWTDVGPTVARAYITPQIEYVNGDIYLALGEELNFFQGDSGISLRKYDGGAWSVIGTPHLETGFGWPGGIAFNNGEPYVSYLIYNGTTSGQANVKKFDGTSWVQVGAQNFNTASGGGTAWFQDIEFSASGTLHMAYYDASGNNGLNVMKFDGSSWVQVGATNFAESFWSGLEFDGDTPYVGFENIGSSEGRGASVMTFDGSSWQYVGDEVFSPSTAYGTSFDISNGVLRIAFLDTGASSGTTVMELGSAVVDSDGDGVADDVDNCSVANPGQEDSNSDGQGDACDPLVTDLTSATEPVDIDSQPVSATATFADADDGDMHTAVFDWGDGNSSAGTVDQAANSASGSHTYADPGVYTVSVTVADGYGAEASATYEYVVVYDPNGGYVTGAGRIDSPAGAYTPDPLWTGEAKFGMISRYNRGKTVPDGNAQFQITAQGFNFESTSLEWLVINQAQSTAIFTGVGTINGSGNYEFTVWATDGGTGGPSNTFRIQIIEPQHGGNDTVIYDNEVEASLTTGNITVHPGR